MCAALPGGVHLEPLLENPPNLANFGDPFLLPLRVEDRRHELNANWYKVDPVVSMTIRLWVAFAMKGLTYRDFRLNSTAMLSPG